MTITDQSQTQGSDAITVLSGPAIVLDRANIDTDTIINIKRCVTLKRGEYGRWALEALRFLPDGSPNPECPLNHAPGDSAVALVTGENFGCGSSREVAVWALRERGIRAIVAPSFGDIFFGNCLENFVLPIRLPVEEHRALALEVVVQKHLDVNLEQRTVSSGQLQFQFDIDNERRVMLMEGRSMLDFILARRAEIVAHETCNSLERPWLTAGLNKHIR